jgi:hypothetical protein
MRRLPYTDSNSADPARGRVENGRAPGVEPHLLALALVPGSSQVVPRHPKAFAYRCFLPDLTGFTDQRCAGPDSRRRARWWWANGADLDREFSSAVADCGYRAPLVPRLARPRTMVWEVVPPVNSGAGRMADFSLSSAPGGATGSVLSQIPRSGDAVWAWRCTAAQIIGTPIGTPGRDVAERVGFEPTSGCPERHFQCRALGL